MGTIHTIDGLYLLKKPQSLLKVTPLTCTTQPQADAELPWPSANCWPILRSVITGGALVCFYLTTGSSEADLGFVPFQPLPPSRTCTPPGGQVHWPLVGWGCWFLSSWTLLQTSSFFPAVACLRLHLHLPFSCSVVLMGERAPTTPRAGVRLPYLTDMQTDPYVCAQSCPTLRPHAPQPARLVCP